VSSASDDVSLSTVQDLLGTRLDERRFHEDLAAFADVLAEIRKLRALDLTDVHPAVVFEPTAAWRARGKR
jgi:putative NADH-flavin reductase